jgi:ClpP class serine protease
LRCGSTNGELIFHTLLQVLSFLHKESYGFDFELTGIEEDLDKTGKLLRTYAKMRELWEKANKNLQRAQRELKKAQMAFVGRCVTPKLLSF